jgi:hypothetical protein
MLAYNMFRCDAIARRPPTMQTMPGNQNSTTGVVAAVISTPAGLDDLRLVFQIAVV